MLALLLTGLLTFQNAPRLKTELPNKAIVFTERYANAPMFSVLLHASSQNVQESPETHGWRHLLEHLLAKEPRGDLDRRLESQGLYLQAETSRDFMLISIQGKTDKLDLALEAIKEILQPLKIDTDAPKKELPILLSELALVPDMSRFSRTMWRQAFGDKGIDPLGAENPLKAATATDIIALKQKQFAPKNLVLAITGDIDIEAITKKVRRILEPIPAVAESPSQPRTMGKPGRTYVDDAFGEARAALVDSCLEPKTMWTYAAAMAISVLFDDASVIYTPTTQPGLIIVGRMSDTSGLGTKIDEMEPAERASYCEIGRNMARNWLKDTLSTPAGNNRWRAMLIRSKWSAKPEMLLEALDTMTTSQFLEGFRAFEQDNAVVGVGSAR
jgi:hypothetical protein